MTLFHVTHLMIPLFLTAWIVVKPLQGWVPLTLQAVGSLVYVAAIAIGSIWAEWPRWLPLVWAATIMAAALWHLKRRSENASVKPTIGSIIGAVLFALLTGTAALLLVAPGIAGRWPAADVPVASLALPLERGRFIVAHGGSREIVNPHLKTLDTNVRRFADWRGQSYAVDLLGYAPQRFLSMKRDADPATYPIWGARVIAPCSGTVRHIERGARDMPVPQMDREHMVGNAVLLACEDFHVLLAHLQSGSIRVEYGQSVAVGDPIGLVGNSGNSSEPHLHIHAQRPGTGEAPYSGQPMQMTIDGSYPVRNMVLTAD